MRLPGASGIVIAPHAVGHFFGECCLLDIRDAGYHAAVVRALVMTLLVAIAGYGCSDTQTDPASGQDGTRSSADASAPTTHAASHAGTPNGTADSAAPTARTSNAAPVVSDPVKDAAIAAYLVVATQPDSDSSGEGIFRTICEFSHLAADDPIVYPGRPGAAHLHTFFGNRLADTFSSTESLIGSGDSSCQGGPLNRSAYWIPALFDTTGQVRVPKSVAVYYKSSGLDPKKIKALPVGLRMIAGNAGATGPQWSVPAVGPHAVEWNCVESSEKYPTVPTCSGELRANVTFPSCWNGSGLDDSALRYPSYESGGKLACPAGFQTFLPRVEYNVIWDSGGSSAGWRLSSDREGVAGGTSLHGDWWGAWQPTVMQTWITSCIAAKRSCDDGALGTTKRLQPARPYDGPYVLARP